MVRSGALAVSPQDSRSKISTNRAWAQSLSIFMRERTLTIYMNHKLDRFIAEVVGELVLANFTFVIDFIMAASELECTCSRPLKTNDDLQVCFEADYGSV